MKNLQKYAFALLCAAGIGHAQADSFYISFDGVASEGVFSSYDIGAFHYDNWSLNLSSTDLPVTVSNGDTVNATITLDQSFTIPASVAATFFEFSLTGTPFPAGDTAVNGTTTFFNNGVQGLSGSVGFLNSGVLANSFNILPPDNGPISFDTVTSNFNITQLDTPATLDRASIYYSRVTPVPEPETYALLLAGLGLVGTAVWRRKRLIVI